MTISTNTQTERLDFAVDAARQASKLILGYYQAADLTVDLKRDRSPVTVADRKAEELIRNLIAESFPEDGVLGEEFDETPSKNGYRWILDPIDGTKSFIHGVPLFGTLIGLEFEEEVVVGVARFPGLNEVVYAVRGNGTWWQRGDGEPERAKVSAVAELSDALFCTTTFTGWETHGGRDVLDRLCAACGLTRSWGDCYGHILVATGRAEIMVDPILNAWDAAALVPILQEAGGHYVDWNGVPSIHTGNGISVNDRLRDQVLALVQSD